ncbi:MAG: HK97 family phage prohead protease [Candidatus Omnitrophica bacterium]|nr:HK97 family phage prohead protease [Candidatus Omnitrophota bacterium]
MLIKGYASTEILDRDLEIIKSDAFSDSLQEYLTSGGVILFNHDRNKVIGKCLKTKVDEKGLWVEAEIFTDDTEIVKAIKERALKSFSVGFIADDVVYSEAGERVYTKGDLLEISIVAVPANPTAVFEIFDEEDKKEVKRNEQKVIIKEVKMENEIVKKETQEIEKQAVEKAVNTLVTSTQFATQERKKIFDGLAEGKIFYIPNQQINMTASTVQIPVLGEATVETGEGGVTNDSEVGANTITLTASQFTARYPLSFLLESVGGEDLETSLETNLKKSIARKFDAVSWGVLKAGASTFDFATKNIKDLLNKIITAGGEYFSEPANCALLVEPKAYAWLAAQDAIFTVQNYGEDAVVKKGSVGKVFGMDVYLIPVTETKEYLIAVNKDYIASGQFGDVNYIKTIDATGTTYIIAKALLAFGKAVSGGIVSIKGA